MANFWFFVDFDATLVLARIDTQPEGEESQSKEKILFSTFKRESETRSCDPTVVCVFLV